MAVHHTILLYKKELVQKTIKHKNEVVSESLNFLIKYDVKIINKN